MRHSQGRGLLWFCLCVSIEWSVVLSRNFIEKYGHHVLVRILTISNYSVQRFQHSVYINDFSNDIFQLTNDVKNGSKRFG